MAEALWHVGIRGEQKGPFTEQDVKDMLARGELAAKDFVWKEGMEKWEPAADVAEFADAVKAAPPPQAKPIPGLECVKGFWADLRAILADPDEGLNAVADKKPLCFSITWVVLGVIVFAILNAQGRVPFIGVAVGTGGRAAVFFKAIFFGAVLYGIWFGALMLTLGPILKSKADWKDGMTILGLATIPTATIGLLMWLLLLIQNPALVALVLTVLGAIAITAKVLILYRVFLHTSGTSRRAALYAVPALYAACNIVYGLLLFFTRL